MGRNKRVKWALIKNLLLAQRVVPVAHNRTNLLEMELTTVTEIGQVLMH